MPGVASYPLCSSAVLALLVASPTSPRASSSATESRYALSSRAMAAPTIPPPMTATSYLRRAPSSCSAGRINVVMTASRQVGDGRRAPALAKRLRLLRGPFRLIGQAGRLRLDRICQHELRLQRQAPQRRRAQGGGVGGGIQRHRECVRSATACMRTRERVSPPSTRSEASGSPRSAARASASSAT